jgi:uncharacterized membrane protein
MQQIVPGSGESVLPVTRKVTTPFGHVVIALDRAIYRVATHWLLAVNSILALHFASILLAPALLAAGHGRLARPLYGYNGLFCHQRNDRSFHLFGEKLACCERCAAIYGALLVVGLLFAFLRGGFRGPRLSDLVALALPAAVDGGAQALGLWQSTAATRVLSGAMLGGAMCWWLLPWLACGFARMRLQIETLFARLVAEGRAHPL